MTARVLVVDDDPAVRSAVSRALRVDYEVAEAADGSEALAQQASSPADVIVLDLLMPEIGGIEVCRSLRRREDAVPILVVTARDAVDDRVEGLDAGADDYLVKPFATEELLARVRALLRRGVDAPLLSFADISLDTGSRLLVRGGRTVELTQREAALLELLLQRPGKVLSRRTAMTSVWSDGSATTENVVDRYVAYLRRKLGDPPLIHTVRGAGFVLRR